MLILMTVVFFFSYFLNIYLTRRTFEIKNLFPESVLAEKNLEADGSTLLLRIWGEFWGFGDKYCLNYAVISSMPFHSFVMAPYLFLP